MDNVIPFKGRSPIFSGELRNKMEQDLGRFSDKPQEAMISLEQVICTFLVSKAKEWATSFGSKIGKKVVEKCS